MLQTTIGDICDDWNVGRFSLARRRVTPRRHDVMARNRDIADDDSILRTLDTLGFDQLWLLAVDTGGGLPQRTRLGSSASGNAVGAS